MADGKMQGNVIFMGNNMPIEGANVQVENGPSAHSDPNGRWGPIDLAAGAYNLTVTADGYRDGIYENVVVLEDDTTELNFGLQLAPG